MSRDAASDPHTELEPHIVSPALRRRLQQCYEHGTKLFEQESYDFDYAHSLLVECVVKDPGNLVYVEALLHNLHRKYDNNKRGARVKGFGGRGGFKKAVGKKDWEEVLKLGPDLLRTNPWDVATLRGLADGCAAYGYHEAELRYLKNALDANPTDAAVNRHCAHSLAHVGQFDQAIACWHRVDEAKRGDEEAQKMMSELQIEKTRQRTGRASEDPPTPPKRPPLPAQQAAAASRPPTPPPRREVQLTPRQELEQQIANNAADLDTYLKLTQLHVDADRYGEAVLVMHKALAASGNDLKFQERLEDVEILRKKHQLAVAEQRAGADATEKEQQLAKQLRDDLNRFEWEIYYGRSERYPRDLEIKFQLGLRLKRLGQYREAMQCFETTLRLPVRLAGSALELGECWQRLKKYSKALDCYRQAAERALPEQTELCKLALYRAGVLATGLQNLEAAEGFFEELAQLDADYKDAASRLDKIRGIRHKG